MGKPAHQVSAGSGKVAAISTEMAGVDNFLSNTTRAHVESGSLARRHGVGKPWKISRWDKAGTFGMASKVLKDARPGAMDALRKTMNEYSSNHSTHKRMFRKLRLLQALVNEDSLEVSRSVFEYKESRAPVQHDVFSILPPSVGPTVEEGIEYAKTATPAHTEGVGPNGPQNGEKRKRVDDEDPIENLSSAPTIMERPRKQVKVALVTTPEIARLNSRKTGQKRKNVEEEFSVNASKPASTAEGRTDERVIFDIPTTTTETFLDQKSEEVSKKLQEDDPLEIAQSASTTMGSTDQLKDAELSAATTSNISDSAETKEGSGPTASINTSDLAYATVQRAIEQLKASMPTDINTTASTYLGLETRLRTELFKLLDGIIIDSAADPSLKEPIKETPQQHENTATLEPQILHTHETSAQVLEPDAIENQSLHSLMVGDGITPEIYKYKRKRDHTADEGHGDVRQDMNHSSKRQKTEHSIHHQSCTSLDVGEQLQNERPPGSSRVIFNGRPPPRKRRFSNTSITALAEGSPPQVLAQKDHNTQELSQRALDSHAARIRETSEANVDEFKYNFLRLNEQSKARTAPSDIQITVPARKEPKDADEAIENWFPAVQKKRDAELRREARKKRREAQGRQAESPSQKRESRPVRCSRKLSEAFQTLLQSKRRINNLPAKYGAEVGAKVRLDGFSSPARGWFHRSKATTRNNDPPRLGTRDAFEVFEDHLRRCDQRKSFSSRYERQILQ